MKVQPSRLRLLVLVCACLLAATVAVDARVAEAAVDRTGPGSYDGEFVAAPPGDNWTFYAKVVHAEPGVEVRLHDPFLRAPLDLYVFPLDAAPLERIPVSRFGAFRDPDTGVTIQTFTWGFNGSTDMGSWAPILHRPSLVRLDDVGGRTDWVQTAVPGDGWMTLESRGHRHDGGLVFLWVNQTSLVGEHVSFFDSLEGSDRASYDTYVIEPSLIAAHQYVAVAQVVLGVALVAGTIALVRSRTLEPAEAGQAELVRLLRKAAGYLRGLSAALLAGGLLLGLAGILLLSEVAAWRRAIATAQGPTVGAVALAVFLLGYGAVILVWAQQVLSVVREERRVTALADQAETL